MSKKPVIRLVFLLLVGGLIGGCATGPKYSEIKSSIPSLAAGKGRVYFYRSGAMGAAIKPEIRLNGLPVGHSEANGFFFVDRDPGQYTVAMSTETDFTMSFALSAGQTRYIRTYLSIGVFVGHPRAELVEPSRGQLEISDLSYTGDNVSPIAASNAAASQPHTEAAETPPAQSASGTGDPRIGVDDLKDLLPSSGKN